MGKFKIVVDRNRCMGAGECVASAPAIFSLDEDEKAVVNKSPENLTDDVKKAIKGCPNFAIKLIEI